MMIASPEISVGRGMRGERQGEREREKGGGEEKEMKTGTIIISQRNDNVVNVRLPPFISHSFLLLRWQIAKRENANNGSAIDYYY